MHTFEARGQTQVHVQPGGYTQRERVVALALGLMAGRICTKPLGLREGACGYRGRHTENPGVS